MEFLRVHQLDAMTFLIGCCAILAVMTMMPKFMSHRRRIILTLMELASMFLLIFDRLSYLYRSDAGFAAGFTVRLSNGMCYLMMLFIPHLVTHFIRDLCRTEICLTRLPKRLFVCDVIFAAGVLLLIVSQFTGLYYTFDAQNRYYRSSTNFISYLFPFLIVLLQESVIIQYRAKLKRNLVLFLVVGNLLPAVAAVLQYKFYGLSFISMTMVFVVIVFYIYVVCSLGEEVEQARVKEIEFYKKTQQRESAMLFETTEALANAIDAKDKYTHGHSARVAVISRMIAKEYGFPDDECDHIYFAGLLHDVGKIGIRHNVLNKHSGLDDLEYEQIRQHPVLGEHILSGIKHSPYLGVGARYHHERYDGKGYPDGLSGEDIPIIARIIAVADAYDAMTSTRSYRAALSIEEVKKELTEGMGTQFDKQFAEIMLNLIDSGAVETKG